MSMFKPHLQRLIEDTLADYQHAETAGFHTRAAVNLLLGTAAVESNFGEYLWQIRGPALGIFQMEPRTFNYLTTVFVEKHRHLQHRNAEDMVWDLRLAVLMARLRYRIHAAPLPDADDVEALGAYWKLVYNTSAGAGTVPKFVAAWHQFVAT